MMKNIVAPWAIFTVITFIVVGAFLVITDPIGGNNHVNASVNGESLPVMCPDGEKVARASQCGDNSSSDKPVTCRDGTKVDFASQCDPPAPKAQPEPTPAPKQAEAPAATHSCDPNRDLPLQSAPPKSEWKQRGTEWKPDLGFDGKATITGHADYTIHTPKYPGDPGLPPGVSELIENYVASAYCDPYKGEHVAEVSSTTSDTGKVRSDCNAIRGTNYLSGAEREYYKRVCEPIFAAQERAAAAKNPAPRSSAPTRSAPAATACGNPGTDLQGGSWTFVGGNQWSLSGSATITGHSAWTVHTNQHAGDPGLPIGKTENTNGGTAYCKPNAAGYAQAAAAPVAPQVTAPAPPAPTSVGGARAKCSQANTIVSKPGWSLLDDNLDNGWVYSGQLLSITVPQGMTVWTGVLYEPGQVVPATANMSLYCI